MRKILHNNRGESIVEVLVSFLMLLIIVGAFTTAVRGANTMMSYANETRKTAFNLELDLQGKLYPAGGGAPAMTDVTDKNYHFVREGDNSAYFDIEAKLGTIEAQAGTETHPFQEYSAAEGTP